MRRNGRLLPEPRPGGEQDEGRAACTPVPFEALKAAAGVLLASPYVPLLFMGEEYGEENPFLYFVDHAGRRAACGPCGEGRREEFKEFAWGG